jgi:hypothetical protein
MVNANLSARKTVRHRRARPAAGHSKASGQDRRRTRLDEARRLDEALAARGQVAYRVVSPDGAFRPNRAQEQRAGARERMWLRSAKVLTLISGSYENAGFATALPTV